VPLAQRARCLQGLEGEPLIPLYAKLHSISAIPGWLRPPVSAMLRMMGKPRMADLFREARARSGYEAWALTDRVLHLRAAFTAAWQAAGLDVLLAPALGLPAFKHGGSADLTPAVSYTFLFNTLHYPAGVVPVTTVRAAEARYEPPAGQRDDFSAAAAASMVGAAGLPVGVQVAALPHRDELALYAMCALEAAIRAHTAGTPSAAATGTAAAAVAAGAGVSDVPDADGPEGKPLGYTPEAIVQATLARVAAGDVPGRAVYH